MASEAIGQLCDLSASTEESSEPVAPIERLPVESLAQIFSHFDFGCSPLSRASGAGILLVCKLWHQIATDTPTLWGFISFDPCGRTIQSLMLSLVRSKQAPLTLWLNMTHMHARHEGGAPEIRVDPATYTFTILGRGGSAAVCESVAREACAAVRPHLNRVYDLAYSGPPSMLFPLPIVPVLHRLSFHAIEFAPMTSSSSDSTIIPSLFTCTPPHLQSLSLRWTRDVVNVFLHVPASQIRDLDLSYLSEAAGSIEFVHECTALQSITISGVGVLQPGQEEPRVHFTSLSMLESLWTLSQLYTRVATAPNLTHLKLGGWERSPDQPLPSQSIIWPTFSRLRTLQLRLQGTQVEFLMKSLEHCPEIESIHLEGDVGFHHFLQRLSYNTGEHRYHQRIGAEPMPFLSPNLKLLRLEYIRDWRISHPFDTTPETTQEAFPTLWPLVRCLLQQRRRLGVRVWAAPISEYMTSLWDATEVGALVAGHPFGDRLRIIDDLSTWPPPLHLVPLELD